MEPADYFILAVFIALGLFSLIAALFNLDWYFNTSGASTFVHKLGRGGARITRVAPPHSSISSGEVAPVSFMPCWAWRLSPAASWVLFSVFDKPLSIHES